MSDEKKNQNNAYEKRDLTDYITEAAVGAAGTLAGLAAFDALTGGGRDKKGLLGGGGSLF